MATDKLMNHSQGESIITNLGTIATNLQNVTAISPAKFGMGYAVCDTAAGTAAKTANIANYVLTEGALVTVKFTNANTASNATLNLNNTGAKPILYKGSALTTDIISAGDICTFIYSTANSGSYNIINVDALSGAGAGTVKSVGAEGGIITDQTSGAAISTTGNVKLNLKSDTAFTATAPDPVEIENKIYPVALDAAGHPAVSVPGTTYTEGTGIDITNNVITNAGVTAVTASDSSTGTNGTISVTTNGTTAEVAVKGLNNAAYKDVATSIPASGADDTKVATEKAVADSISGKAIGTNSSTTNAIATFAGTDGKTLADSAVTIAKNATGVTDDDTKVPTSKAVKTYVDATATGISRYIGTITAASQLSTTAKKGDFYIVSTAWTGVHAGDEIIAEKDNPTATIDGTNWTLLHNEADTNTTYTFAEGTTNGKFTVTPSDTGTAQSVTVHGLAASAYKGVDTTPTASSSNLVESGGVASALNGKQDTLTFDGTYNASTNKAATVSTVTNAIGALDVSEVSVGSVKTINKISQTDGKISVSTTDIRSASTSQTGIVQLNDAINNTSTTQAATANAVKKVNDKVETNKSNILYGLQTGVKNLFDLKNADITTGVTNISSSKTDTSLTVTTAGEKKWSHVSIPMELEAGTYHVLTTISGRTADSSAITRFIVASGAGGTPELGGVTFTNNGTIDFQFTTTGGTVYLIPYPNYSGTGYNATFTASDIMVCTKAAWDQEPNVYRPFALPNYDLTRLEAEDRAALADVVDNGAKNKLQYDLASLKAKNTDGTWNNNAYTVGGITYTLNSDMSISISGTRASTGYAIFNLADYTAVSGDLMSQGTVGVQGVFFYARSGSSSCNTVGYTDIASTDVGVNRTYALAVTAVGLTVNQRYYPMICTNAAFGVSKAFVPYRPNYDLVVSEIGHHTVDDGNTNHSTATCNCSNWTAGVYLVAVNRYQNPTTAYGTALYLMTVNDNILPLFTTIVETADCKATFALSNDKVLSITYPHSAFWQVYAKRI